MQKQEAQHHGTFIAASKIGSQRKELHCTRCCRSQRVSTGSTSSKPPKRAFFNGWIQLFSVTTTHTTDTDKNAAEIHEADHKHIRWWRWQQPKASLQQTLGDQNLEIMKWSGNGWDLGFAPISHGKKEIDLHQRIEKLGPNQLRCCKAPILGMRIIEPVAMGGRP